MKYVLKPKDEKLPRVFLHTQSVSLYVRMQHWITLQKRVNIALCDV